LIGDALLSDEDLEASAIAHQSSLNLFESLSKEDPASVQKVGDVVFACEKLADVAMTAGRFQNAGAWFQRGLETLHKTPTTDPGVAALLAQRKAQLERDLAVANAGDRIMVDTRFINGQPPPLARQMWIVRALTFARSGRHTEAARAAEVLRALAAGDGENLAQVGRIYSLCSRAASRAALVLASTRGERLQLDSLRAEYADKSVRALQRAVQLAPWLLQVNFAPDLDPVRDHPGFALIFKSNQQSR
jgi:hypothetical protein